MDPKYHIWSRPLRNDGRDLWWEGSASWIFSAQIFRKKKTEDAGDRSEYQQWDKVILLHSLTRYHRPISFLLHASGLGFLHTPLFSIIVPVHL
jgi:hypothetical protein